MGLIQDIKKGIKDSGHILDELAELGTKGLVEIGRKLGIVPPVHVPVPVPERRPNRADNRGEVRFQISDLSTASLPSWNSDWSQ